MFGWITKCVSESGEEEFQSAFMDITQRYREKKEQETTEKWITGNAAEADKDRLRRFFGEFCQRKLTLQEGRPPQITYRALFSSGEAEFTYFDMEQNAYRRIRAICSGNYKNDGKCYVMLYHLDAKVTDNPQRRIRIRTFGYFDVFVDDKPIAFRNEKSKELLALLVDRRGGFVSSEEAIGFLWEDEPANTVTLSRYRKVALRLKNLLEEYGISDIVESVNGKRRLAAEKIQCVLYDYLTGQEEHAQLFKGSYLTNYSWGETTLAELTGDHFYALGE